MRKTGNYRPEPVLALATGATRRVQGYSCDTTQSTSWLSRFAAISQ